MRVQSVFDHIEKIEVYVGGLGGPGGGHLCRMDDNRYTKRIWETKIRTMKKRGRRIET